MRGNMHIVAALAVVMLAMTPVLAGAPGDPFTSLGGERQRELRTAPALSLPALDGGTVRLPQDFRGKAVLISFFTTT
jgi:hypothetical protein